MTMIALSDARLRSRSPGGAMLCVARREFVDAIAGKWFLLCSLTFALLALAISFVSLSTAGSHAFAGFSKTTAGLLNLVMLVVPLMALTSGSASIAAERERGTLLYLLAQPISRVELLLGKYLGLSGALICSICVGFAISAIVLAWHAGSAGAGSYALLVANTIVLALAMLSTAFLVSVLARRASIASGISIFLWLTLVFLSDLGLMAGTILFKLRVQEVFALAIVNPMQAFKMGVIHAMNDSLDVLGPVGAYATHTLGNALPLILAGVLVIWIALPLLLASLCFARRSTL